MGSYGTIFSNYLDLCFFETALTYLGFFLIIFVWLHVWFLLVSNSIKNTFNIIFIGFHLANYHSIVLSTQKLVFEEAENLYLF